jgi:hypothetical protein
MAVIGYSRIAKGADEYRVERPKRVVTTGWNGDAGLEEMVRAPRQLLNLDAAHIEEDARRFGNDLGADTVARYDCKLERGQDPTLVLIIRKDLCIILFGTLLFSALM